MKTKLLSTIRKFYEFHYTEDGKVVTRNKKTGEVNEYDSIEEYIKDMSYSDTLISHLQSHKWNKKKLMIREKKSKRPQDYWNTLKNKVSENI